MAAPLVVGFNPVPMAQQVAVADERLRRAAGAALCVVVAAAVTWWQRPDVGGRWLLGASLLAVLAVVAVTLRLARARHHLGRIRAGAALEAGPDGLVLHGLDGRTTTLAWSAVARVRTAGLKVGAGPEVVVETAAGRVWSMPLSFLDALPGTIDAGLRACSAGRVGLDLSALDALF